MKEEKVSGADRSETVSALADLQAKASNVVPRRSFIKGLGVVGATLMPGAALLKAEGINLSGKLSNGDADLLRVA